MNNCKGLFGWLFGHHFDDVYDFERSVPEAPSFIGVTTPWLEDALNAAETRKSVYVKHVCTRCGQEIKRQ